LVEDEILIRKSLPSGYLSQMSDRELINYVKQNYKGKTISSVEKDSGSAVIRIARKRGLIDKLVEQGALIRRQRCNGLFEEMSNKSFISYVIQNHKGKTLTEICEKDKTAYRELKKRELDDKLIEKGILVRKVKTKNGFFSKMSDNELFNYIKDNFYGKSPVFFQKGNENNTRVYNLARERGILNKLFEEGILVKGRPNFLHMTNDELIGYIKENYQGFSLVQLHRKRGAIYQLAREKGLLDYLVNEKILVRLTGKYKNMTDEQLISYVSEKYKGKSLGQLDDIDSKVYETIRKRNLIDYFVNQRILIRLNGNNSSQLESLLENYVGGAE